MELKSRLSNIQTPTAPIYQTLGVKIAAVASITAIVGVGTYYLLRDSNDLGLTDIDLTKQNSIELIEKEDIPVMPEVHVPPVEEIEVEEVIAEKPATPIIEEEDKTSSTTSIKSTVPPNKPEVVRPEIAGDLDEDEMVTEDISSENNFNTIEEIKENIESKVEVEAEKSRKYPFHYKFYNNKLFLLGDFKNSPYEIIELNSAKGKKYFLYYEGSFYRLYSDRMKPAPLEKVDDKSIIDELNIIMDNK
jgi:hypothetical protein